MYEKKYLFLEEGNEPSKIVLILATVSLQIALNDKIASLADAPLVAEGTTREPHTMHTCYSHTLV